MRFMGGSHCRLVLFYPCILDCTSDDGQALICRSVALLIIIFQYIQPQGMGGVKFCLKLLTNPLLIPSTVRRIRVGFLSGCVLSDLPLATPFFLIPLRVLETKVPRLISGSPRCWQLLTFCSTSTPGMLSHHDVRG